MCSFTEPCELGRKVHLTSLLMKKKLRPRVEVTHVRSPAKRGKTHLESSSNLSTLMCPHFPSTSTGHPPSSPVVDTVQGKVLGKYVSLEGFAQSVAVFLGVPFAKPPLGSLRFAPPQPAEPWLSVKNTTSYPPM